MKLDRRFVLGYDVVLFIGIVVHYINYGPVLFGLQQYYYFMIGILLMGMFYVNCKSLLHPTPLEIVTEVVNLIVTHHFVHPFETYDDDEVENVTERFIKTRHFSHFFYEEFNYTSLSPAIESVKLKLAVAPRTFNEAVIIVKVNETKFIQFTLVKETNSRWLALLKDWKLDEMRYVNEYDFDRVKRGII